MSGSRMALYVTNVLPVKYLLNMAQYAEQKGFSEIWVGDLGNEFDGGVMVATILALTQKVRVGSAILPIWPRNPVTTAAMWCTMENIYPGRPILGLGAWFEPMATKLGVQRVRCLRAMREYVESIRMLFTRQPNSYRGDFVNIDYVQLDPTHAEMGPVNIPIYVGATGPMMHKLAGKIANGVLMNYFVSPDYVKQMVDLVKVGLGQSGRNFEVIDRPELIAVAISKDRKKALDAARMGAVYYLGYEPHIQKASGASQDLLDEIHKITTWPSTPEKHRKAANLIPEELIQNICAVGTPDECRETVGKYIQAGCTCPILAPFTDEVELLIDTFSRDL